MKKITSIVLAFTLCVGLLLGCNTQTKNEVQDEAQNANTIYPLPETLDINALDNCTVAVSLNKGDAYVDDSGKMVMNVKVYTYALYDMVDIASLKENDVIVRQNEEVKVTEFKRLDSGLVRINGGEENGGFDLISNDATVYFEVGMDDAKAYYELGEVTLPVSDVFEYVDASNPDAVAKTYYPGDFLTENAEIAYDFTPDNTSIVIENGLVIAMNKIYKP